MRALQINVVYPNKSTGSVVLSVHKRLLASFNYSFVVYGRCLRPIETTVFKSCNEVESNIHHAIANVFDNVYGGCFLATNKMIRLIRKLKPDVVHLHCCNGYFVNLYKLFNYLSINNFKVVITNHAEFYYTGNCGYAFDCKKWKSGCGNCPHIKEFNGKYSLDRTHKNWIKMKKAFQGFDKNNLIITSVSPWIMSRSSSSPILGQYTHKTVLNGVDTDRFVYHNMISVRKDLGLPFDKKLYIFICSNWNEKSKREYFEHVVDRLPCSSFILVGAPSDYKHKDNVINLGFINDQTLLSKYYSASNKTLLLSKRETFSLPVAESLCSGTPVVGFYSGGPETITIPKYSEFCEFGDIDSLIKLISNERDYDRERISNEAREKYSQERMANEYIEIYNELLFK